MSSITACNQLTQQPSSTSCKKLKEINSNQFFIQRHQPAIKLNLSMQKEPGLEFLLCETLDKYYTTSVPKCKIPQSEACTLQLTINNLAINSNRQ
jgi:hypothetical protein